MHTLRPPPLAGCPGLQDFNRLSVPPWLHCHETWERLTPCMTSLGKLPSDTTPATTLMQTRSSTLVLATTPRKWGGPASSFLSAATSVKARFLLSALQPRGCY